MSSLIFYKKESSDGSANICSLKYDDLSATLSKPDQTMVGVEINADGQMQHYLYQHNATLNRICRYPLRYSDGDFKCLRGYSELLNASEALFGPINPLSSDEAVILPANKKLYFFPEDKPAVVAKISAPSESTSYHELTTEAEACLDALNVMLSLRGDDITEEFEQAIRNRAQFVEIVDEICELMDYLKQCFYSGHGNVRTKNPLHEQIYQAFCNTHGFEVDAISRLASMRNIHNNLKKLVPLKDLLKLNHSLKTASQDVRESIQQELRVACDSSDAARQKEANLILFFNGMMAPQEKTEFFLQMVAEGQQLSVSRMLTKEPQLLLEHGQLVDFERRFLHMSAFKYALWAGDWHMYEMMLSHIPKNSLGEQILKQLADEYNQVTSVGIDYSYTIKVGPREGEEVVVTHETGFDYQPILLALEAYHKLISSEPRDEDAIHQCWVSVVGFAQRYLPMCVINEYARRDRSFNPDGELTDFEDSSLPRTASMYNFRSSKEEPILGRERDLSLSHWLLGVHFAICRGNLPAVQMSSGLLNIHESSSDNTPDFVDYLALKALKRVQDERRADLGSKLQSQKITPGL